jgi:hypothetical protein
MSPWRQKRHRDAQLSNWNWRHGRYSGTVYRTKGSFPADQSAINLEHSNYAPPDRMR